MSPSFSPPRHALGPLASGLLLTSAAPLTAGIIYNTTPVTLTPEFTSTLISIDGSEGNAQDEFSFGTNAAWTWNSNVKPSTATLSAQNSSLLSSTALNSGDTVDASHAPSVGSFSLPSGDAFVGFSFVSGQTLYGWASVTHTPSSIEGQYSSASITAWAFESSGAGIQVGQTSAIPEPANAVGALALLAGSAAMFRRRRARLDRAAA